MAPSIDESDSSGSMHTARSGKEIDLSVVIITLNEEKSIERCLRSLPRGSEVVILDSGSTDKTCEIAKKHGARVESQPFQSYSDQKNAACALATRRWILSVDADEELSGSLKEAIENVLARATASDTPGYHVQRQLVFMGRRMRYGKTTDEPLRLFLKGAGAFRNDVHERFTLRESDAKTEVLPGPLFHYSYDDITDYFRTFNNFTSLVAKQHQVKQSRQPAFLLHILRPWFEFAHRYILRLGFLDGYPGYCYALFGSLYTFVKYAKYAELQEKR